MLQETLAKRSKTDLIGLVEAMVTREPILLSLISAPLLPTPSHQCCSRITHRPRYSRGIAAVYRVGTALL
ncbi:hypothetical protein VB714_07145 [Spirulina sp. 06S082]|nr:hypothetical protein [Spirulina sp. 06S082]MEA5468638.1 hypothetical protein [Spirulina sp. 06S082]